MTPISQINATNTTESDDYTAPPFTMATTNEVFFTFYNQTGFDNVGYVVLIGMLTTLYSFTGYEAAGHMSEE